MKYWKKPENIARPQVGSDDLESSDSVIMSYKNSFFYSDENEEEFPPGRHANILKQWLKQNIKNSKKYKDDSNSYWEQFGCNNNHI